jgi:hypothetical protein
MGLRLKRESPAITDGTLGDVAPPVTTTRWWSPALRYILSYRRDRILSSTDNAFFEVAAVDSGAP